MRTFLVVLSAAVTAGLGVFFAFNAFGAIASIQGNVLIPMDVFVGLIACLTLAASALALGYRALLVRGDGRLLMELRSRLERLEGSGPAN
jgi:hypothetical protein